MKDYRLGFKVSSDLFFIILAFLGFTHLRVHQGKKHAIEVSKAYQKRSYICPVCGKGFSYKGLENHFNRHTEEEKKASPLIRYPVKVGTTKIVRCKL